jgi:hypothetical protein
MSLQKHLQEADELIKKASAKPGQKMKTVEVDSGAIKLAEAILADSPEIKFEIREKTASKQDDLSPLEKVAEAFAIVDTLLNIEEILNLQKLAGAAIEKGLPHEKVAQAITEKSTTTLVSITSLLDPEKTAEEKLAIKKVLMHPAAKMLGVAGIASTATAATHGKKQKKKGYEQALSDVRQAFQNY